MNGEYQEDSDIGKLMHDFTCANPDEMKYKLLAEKTRYYKKDEKGVNKMSPVIVEYAQEIAAEEKAALSEEFAINLLEDGTLSIPKIAEVSKLSESKVRELAKQLQVTAK